MRNFTKCLASLLAIAVLVLTASNLHAQNKTATLHQVTVGVSKYAPASGQKDLALAHKDAQDMAAHWKSNGAQLFARVQGDAMIDQQATRESVLRRLDDVVANARAGEQRYGDQGAEFSRIPHDMLLVYKLASTDVLLPLRRTM